jgi:putative NADH-flavin reductase
MKLIVFGATGATGLEILKQAPALGHTVTSFARSNALPGTVITGSVLDEAAVTDAIRGHDVVLSCLGTRPWRHENICSDGIRVIAKAMQATGVKRLIALSTQGAGDSEVGTLAKPFARVILGRAFKDKEVMERELEGTSLDWVVVRPGILTNGAGRGTWRVSTTNELRGGKIARADVAAFMLQQLEAREYVGKRPVIVY